MHIPLDSGLDWLIMAAGHCYISFTETTAVTTSNRSSVVKACLTMDYLQNQSLAVPSLLASQFGHATVLYLNSSACCFVRHVREGCRYPVFQGNGEHMKGQFWGFQKVWCPESILGNTQEGVSMLVICPPPPQSSPGSVTLYRDIIACASKRHSINYHSQTHVAGGFFQGSKKQAWTKRDP
jgi:hypothetical protein